MAIIKKNFPIVGMGCAACVAKVERALQGLEGVKNAAVSLASNSAQVEYDTDIIRAQALREAVRNVGFDMIADDTAEALEQADKQREKDREQLKRDFWISLFITVILMVFSMYVRASVFQSVVLIVLSTIAVFYCGRRFIIAAIKQARHANANMDTLVALSTVISYLFSLFNLFFPQVWTGRGLDSHIYFESCSMIVCFILMGRTLEARAKNRTTDSIRALMSLQKDSEQYNPGDIVEIKPGQRIPVDGIVIEGSSYVDESMLTGEPMAVFKEAGAKLYAGTMNAKGSLSMKAEKVGGDTMLSAIIRMVRDAQGSKAAIQKTVDKVASVFVPIIIIIAILTLLAWIILDTQDGLTMGLLSMVSVLVIACPCSLGLATPTALIAGIGNGASKGILIKDADSLQSSAKIDVVVLDKTGTITQGHPVVTQAIWLDETDKLKAILLTIERKSEHPLAEAIVNELEKEQKIRPLFGVTKFESIPGMGVKAVYASKQYYAGKALNDEDAKRISIDGSLVYFYEENELKAVLGISDKIKPNASQAISSLKTDGIAVYMLTGDNEASATKVAQAVGISRVLADALPSDKLAFVEQLQKEGHRVAMVGDGINDSAALAKADLSIAMGKGSDIAMKAAMVTIVSSDISKITQLLHLSARSVKIIRQNLFWAFFYNIMAVPLAAGLLYPLTGLMINPMIAAGCMTLSSVCVVTNSLRLRR